MTNRRIGLFQTAPAPSFVYCVRTATLVVPRTVPPVSLKRTNIRVKERVRGINATPLASRRSALFGSNQKAGMHIIAL